MAKRSSKLRTQNVEHIDGEGSWAVSYGDMITLLLSFFVIYFSTDFDKQVEEKLGQKVEEEIGKVAADISSDLSLGDKFTQKIELKDLSLKDGEDIPENIDIKIYKTGKSFLIYFAGTSFFDSGKVVLRKDVDKILDKIVQRVEPFLGNYKLKVRAFTDKSKVRIRARYKNNLELSALRAVSAMSAFEKKGIPRHRMEVAGYGPMSEKLLHFLDIKEENKKQKRSLSRSIMILLKRDEYEQS